ncbi:MAG TPA: hypothetical protein DCK97_28740 [Tistrella mobilis]|uniref:AAA+ ATPase domain-containing protein n=1 Tax=Tistrella mobilis TaxID=171437 RepID=A0A3B9IUB6_9PROT|nr:hypothetical protein [Tistrella mobilis]
MVTIRTIEPNAAPEKIPFCETETGRRMLNLFTYCQDAPELGLITGKPGVGKSTAARHYVRSAPGRYLVTASPATSALVPCLQRIAEAIGAHTKLSGAGALAAAITTALEAEPQSPMLIVDEAHHLSDDSIEELRILFDTVPMGMVLVAGRQLRDRLDGNPKQWSQLTSRLSAGLEVDGPLPADVDAICSHHGIDDRDARTTLRRAAHHPGALRTVTKLIGVAAKLAGTAPIVAAHVKDAAHARGLTY